MDTDPHHPDGEAALTAYMHGRFVELWLSQSVRSQIGQTFIACVIASLWYGGTQSPRVFVWLAAVALLGAVRVFFGRTLIGQHPPDAAHRRIIALLVVVGTLLAMPFLQFAAFGTFEQALLTAIYLGLAAAAPPTSIGYSRIFLAYAAPLLLPVAAAWSHLALTTGTIHGHLMAACIVAFLAYLLSVNGRIREVFEEASRFRHGEQRLNRALQLALDRADESSRAKTQFLAAASHDLRQPIHGITVLIGALSLRPLESGTREIVDRLEAVNRVLASQLDSLLDISKLDAGVVRPNLSPQRPADLMQSLAKGLQPVAAQRRITLGLGALDDAAVMTDPALLSRVLGNLADNALKFTGPEGRVTLSVVREADRLRLRIEDTGIGIRADEQEKVFREFYQIDNPGRDRAKGLGLGLSIVSRLCALLGADLDLDSAPGRGTTVTVTLPVLASALAHGPEEPDVPEVSLAGLAVLVVDDEDLVRESMGLVLAQLGCRPHLASDEPGALDIVQRTPIDIALCDFRLGERGDGLAVVHALRAARPGLRAMLITGDTAPERIRRAQASGLTLLHKPVGVALLRATLTAVMAGTTVDAVNDA